MPLIQSLPEKFLQRLDIFVPQDKRDEVLTSFTIDKPLVIRINTLRSTVNEVRNVLIEANIPAENVPWYPEALILNIDDKRKVTALPAYENGLFYIQNLSSMIPALVLEPQPDETILDMCAAPGSKTTQIAAMMQNKGTIIANEKSRQRTFKLSAVLKQQGVRNTKITTFPGEILWRKYPNYFDKTLVDAPCSMEGRFLTNDPETYKDWSPKKVKVLSHMQRWLLRSAFTATKPGGILVYSTCTLSPEENEEVIQWLVDGETYPFTIEPISLPSLETAPGLSSWKEKQFHSDMKHCLRIFPNETMEGFFVAKIRKSAY